MKSDKICRLTNNIITMLEKKKLVSSYIGVFILMSFKISIQRRQWHPTPVHSCLENPMDREAL